MELAEAVKAGHAAAVIFLIQTRGCRLFRPNEAMDRAFADALRTAAACGVKVLAYDARVTDGEILFGEPVAVDLG